MEVKRKIDEETATGGLLINLHFFRGREAFGGRLCRCRYPFGLSSIFLAP